MNKRNEINFFLVCLGLLSILFAGCLSDNYESELPPKVIEQIKNQANVSQASVVNISNSTITRQNATIKINELNDSPTLTPNISSINSTVRVQLLPINQTPLEYAQINFYSPPDFTPVSQIEYAAFIDNPQVKNALGDLLPTEKQFLLNAATELEQGDKQSWNEFDGRANYSLSRNEARRAWLRRVALSAYNELHHKVPWTMLDYADSDLRYLLSFCVEDYTETTTQNYAGFVHYPCQQFFYLPNPSYQNYESLLIWNPNPLAVQDVARELLESKQPATQGELINALVLRMRLVGWQHISSVEDTQFLTQGKNGMLTTMDRLWQLKRGGSGWNSVFVASILRSLNVPARVGEVNGHGYVWFSTENKGMYSGDWIHGWSNGLPIRDSFLSNDQINYLFSLPVCNSQVEKDKIQLGRILHYYDNLSFNERIYYGSNGYCNLRERYISKLLESFKTTDTECLDGSQPAKGKWTTPFTTEEAQYWQQLVASYADRYNICN